MTLGTHTYMSPFRIAFGWFLRNSPGTRSLASDSGGMSLDYNAFFHARMERNAYRKFFARGLFDGTNLFAQ